MAYAIGQTVWSRGDEVTITTAPYIAHGGEFQDGVTDTGKTVCLATPEQRSASVEREQHAWREMQAGFSRMKQET